MPDTGETQYQCPCGTRFCRKYVHSDPVNHSLCTLQLIWFSDVLARHIRRCSQAQSDQASGSKPSTTQTRSKSACNRCAKLKLKCDSADPCFNCQHKSVACKYTRQGYHDPYTRYRINVDIDRRNSASTSREKTPRPSNVELSPDESNDESEAPASTQADHFVMSGSPLDITTPQMGIDRQAQRTATDSGPSATDLLASDGYTLASQDPTMIPDMNVVNSVPGDLYTLAPFDFPYPLESSLFHSAAIDGMNFPDSMILPLLGSENAGKTPKCNADTDFEG